MNVFPHVSLCGMYLHACCLCIGTLMQQTKYLGKVRFLIDLDFMYKGRVSHLDSQLTDLSSPANNVLQGSPLSACPISGTRVGGNTHQTNTQGMRVVNLVLTLVR